MPPLLETLLPACSAEAITSITLKSERARAVYIGVNGNYDFCFDGTNWVTFYACSAGIILPISPWGVRNTSDHLAPPTNAIVFLR